MQDLLHFEADRRVINIAISSLDTEMSASDKLKLFPECGGLFPVGQADLAKCSSLDEIRMVIRNCASHGQLSRRLMTADLSSLDKVNIFLSFSWIPDHLNLSSHYTK